MTSPRLPMLSIVDAKAAAVACGVPELAAELSIFRIWLHHPKLAKWMSDLLMGMLWEGRLDLRVRELIIMRLGWATASDYEWTQHWRIALGLKVPEADILGVKDWRNYDGFGPAERAAMAAVDETLAEGAMSEATWAECVAHVSSDTQVLLELVTAIGLWRMVSATLRSLEVPLEDGVASWPPTGERPS